MKGSRFETAQIIAILQEAAAGTPPAVLLRRRGISLQTFYAWKNRYGDLEFIQSGKRHQHAHLQRFNGKFRAECPNQHGFLSLPIPDATLNNTTGVTERPHDVRSPLTPSEYPLTSTHPTAMSAEN
jgi:hypothetical protein